MNLQDLLHQDLKRALVQLHGKTEDQANEIANKYSEDHIERVYDLIDNLIGEMVKEEKLLENEVIEIVMDSE